MTRRRLTTTRLIAIHLLVMVLIIAIVFIWRPGHAKPASNANVLHTTPGPRWCIYWDGAQAYDAPCQDYRINVPLALTGWDVFGPPPTPAPWGE